MNSEGDDKYLQFVGTTVDYLALVSEVDVPVASYNDFVVLYGHIAQVHRFARGYLELRNRGLAREGQALVRSALEHAVVAQWAYLTPEGARRLHSRMQNQQRQIWADVSTVWPSDEIRAGIDRFGEVDQRLEWPNFQRGILAPLDSDRFLATIYGVLSLVVHPSHSVVELVQDDEGRVSLNHGRGDAQWETFANLAAATSCLLARWILARLLNDQEALTMLDCVSDELLIPLRLDHNLPPERRRFPDEI